MFAILKNERYTGRVSWKRTRTVTNPRTGKKAAVPRPDSERLCREIPAMHIVTDELWCAVRRREQEVARNTQRRRSSQPSRQSQYPTRLFDLYCRDCGKPLQLARSGKYAQLFCPRGKDGLRGCTLKSSKGVRIMEECILAYVRQRFIASQAVDKLVDLANRFLQEEAAKPAADVAALDRQIRSATEKTKRLANRLAQLGDGPAADSLLASIQETEDMLAELKRQRRAATQGSIRPERIDRRYMEHLLTNLRQLLHDNVPSAHATLAERLGAISVKLGERRGRSFAWLAELKTDSEPVVLEIAQRRATAVGKCP